MCVAGGRGGRGRGKQELTFARLVSSLHTHRSLRPIGCCHSVYIQFSSRCLTKRYMSLSKEKLSHAAHMPKTHLAFSPLDDLRHCVVGKHFLGLR